MAVSPSPPYPLQVLPLPPPHTHTHVRPRLHPQVTVAKSELEGDITAATRVSPILFYFMLYFMLYFTFYWRVRQARNALDGRAAAALALVGNANRCRAALDGLASSYLA